MGIEAVIVLGVVAAVLLALMLTRIAADAILVAALTLLLVVPVPASAGWKLGVLDPGQAIGGFASTGLATVAVLFVVVSGLRETGGIDWISTRILGKPQTLRSGMVRMTFPVAGMSAFLNNTPVVALMIPAVADWCKRTGLAPSKVMLPLSYAAILGGTCSLIGTSTNLVVAGMVVDQKPNLEPLGIFDITWIGVPCVLVGLAFLLLVGPKLLPNRGSPASVMSDPREYTLEMIVPEGSTLAGKTVEDAGLRSLPGCFLVEVEREGGVMAAMGPHTVLRAGDRLVFAGVVEAIKDLQALRGLTPATDQVFKLDSPRFRRRLFEAVVSRTSPAAGRTIREGRFRNTYDAVVIAVAREGERLKGKLGDIELKPGDTLLLEADPGFVERHRNSRDFLLVSALEDSTPRRHARAPLAVVFLAAMVVLAAIGVLEMLSAALLAAGLMVLTRCCTVTEARRSIDWSLLIVIGAALGIGEALRVSGASSGIANGILGLVGQHPWMVLLAIYVITSLATEAITNNAAVVLVFPIAVDAATRLDVSLMPYVIAIMIGGSASFATPLGYQTNLMVYGPGGYRFSDFLRIGIPMNMLIGITTVTLTPLVFPF